MVGQTPHIFRTFNVLTNQYDRELYPSAEVDQEGNFHFIAEPDQFLVEQYTGLNSKDKKMIFEYDVIETEPNRRYYIVKHEGQYCVVKIDESQTKYFYPLTKGMADRCTVLGTVHEQQYRHLNIGI